MATLRSSWKCSDIAHSIVTRVSFYGLCGLRIKEMSTNLDFPTGSKPTLIGDLGDLYNSSNSAETGLERARRLTICPPGEIASTTSSLSLPLLVDEFMSLSCSLPINRAFSESSSSISQPASLRIP